MLAHVRNLPLIPGNQRNIERIKRGANVAKLEFGTAMGLIAREIRGETRLVKWK
jgi:hypothetical protein